MKWFFDSGFDYINEFFENWNRKIKKMRNTCILVAVLLIVAGILCIAFPVEVFAVIQYVAAAALIIIGIYHIVSYVSTTYYFKDPMLIVMAVVNILMGVLVAAMPLILTVNVLTFMLAVPPYIQRSAEDFLRVQTEIFRSTEYRHDHCKRRAEYHSFSDIHFTALCISGSAELHHSGVSDHDGDRALH